MNNDMEQFIGRFRRKWKRITGCSRMNEWIIHRAPMAIYMFNIIGKDSPLNKLGFDTDLANMLSSVSYATYKKCMKEYEVRKEDDRIRKRGNHDLDSVLKEVEMMNELVSVGSETMDQRDPLRTYPKNIKTKIPIVKRDENGCRKRLSDT